VVGGDRDLLQTSPANLELQRPQKNGEEEEEDVPRTGIRAAAAVQAQHPPQEARLRPRRRVLRSRKKSAATTTVSRVQSRRTLRAPTHGDLRRPRARSGPGR